MYAAKASLRPIHDRMIELARKLGDDVKICPCTTIVPLYRNHVFAEIKPTTKTRIDLGFALKSHTGKLPKRLIDTGGLKKGDRITHRIPLADVSDIDDEVKKWLKVAYELDGKRIERLPCDAEQLRRCKPIYETIAGWKEPVDDVRHASEFPAGALAYVRRIEELVGIPVGVLSVGPDRAQTILTDAASELALQPIA